MHKYPVSTEEPRMRDSGEHIDGDNPEHRHRASLGVYRGENMAAHHQPHPQGLLRRPPQRAALSLVGVSHPACERPDVSQPRGDDHHETLPINGSMNTPTICIGAGTSDRTITVASSPTVPAMSTWQLPVNRSVGWPIASNSRVLISNS